MTNRCPVPGWVLVGLFAAAAAALPCLHPITTRALAPREVRIEALILGQPDQVRLEWRRIADNHVNGYWIDPPKLPQRDQHRVLERTFNLPWYEWADLRVSWQGGPGLVSMPDPPTIATRLLGSRFHAGAPVGVVEGGDGKGRAWLDLRVPSRAWWEGLPLRLAVALAVGCAAFAAVGGLWRAGDWWRVVMMRHTLAPARVPRWVVWSLLGLALAPAAWLPAWAPMLMEGDGAGFVGFALRLWETGRLTSFDGWRLPGYGVLLSPFVGLMENYSAGVGLMQAAMGMVTAWLCFDLLRRRVPMLWALVGACLVGLDPMILMWQRYVLSEALGTLLVTGLVWMLDRALPGRADAAPGWPRAVGWGVLLGAWCAYAIYTRANFQVFLMVAPAAILAAHARAGRPGRGLACAAVCVLVAAGALAPAYIHNKRTLGRYELIVGADHNRCVFSWQNRAIEINQVGAFTLEEYRGLRDRRDAGGFHELAFTDFLARSTTIPVPPGSSPIAARDYRSGVVTRESLARRPDLFARRMGEGVLAVLGFFIRDPWYYSHTADNMSRVLRGRFDGRTRTNLDDNLDTDRLYRPDHRAVLERHRRPVGHVQGSANAGVFNGLWAAYRVLRPGLIVLMLLAGFRHLRRMDWAMLAGVALVVGNALAIALVQFTGMDRYGAPFYAVMTVAGVAGLFSPTRAAPGGASSPKLHAG